MADEDRERGRKLLAMAKAIAAVSDDVIMVKGEQSPSEAAVYRGLESVEQQLRQVFGEVWKLAGSDVWLESAALEPAEEAGDLPIEADDGCDNAALLTFDRRSGLEISRAGQGLMHPDQDDVVAMNFVRHGATQAEVLRGLEKMRDAVVNRWGELRAAAAGEESASDGDRAGGLTEAELDRWHFVELICRQTRRTCGPEHPLSLAVRGFELAIEKSELNPTPAQIEAVLSAWHGLPEAERRRIFNGWHTDPPVMSSEDVRKMGRVDGFLVAGGDGGKSVDVSHQDHLSDGIEAVQVMIRQGSSRERVFEALDAIRETLDVGWERFIAEPGCWFCPEELKARPGSREVA